MPKASDFFAGKSLKAADIKGKEPIVTIKEVTTQDFDDGLKPIIHFKNTDKTLVCNKTNWNSIVEITGLEDSDDWAGQRIKLVVARVEYQGKRVDAIRIDPPGEKVSGKPAPSRRQPTEEEIKDEAIADNMGDDDIPF